MDLGRGAGLTVKLMFLPWGDQTKAQLSLLLFRRREGSRNPLGTLCLNPSLLALRGATDDMKRKVVHNGFLLQYKMPSKATVLLASMSSVSTATF